MVQSFHEQTWLTWLVKVRVIIITFLLGIGLALARLTAQNIPELFFVSVIVLWYTISVYYVLLLSISTDYRKQAKLQILADLLFVTAIVYFTGGVETSFNFLYPLVIIIASILLSRAWAYLVAALSFILFGGILELSYFGQIPSYGATRGDLKSLQAVIFINLFAFMAIAYLSSSLVAKLRQVDVQLQFKSGALEDLQALHANIIASMSGGIITTDLKGRIRLVNTSGAQLLGREAQDLKGHNVAELFLDRLPDVESSKARSEVRSVTPAGREKTFSVTISALVIPERGLAGHVYTFDDLTEVRRLEREVRMRDRLAAVGRMAAGIAHEIRNPLSSIAGSVKVFSSLSVLSDEQRALVDIVNRESERLNSIISDFLFYSREKSYRFVRTDLRTLLEDALTLLQNRPQQAKVEIIRDFQVDEAPALVEGDKIKQVFWNLCENALRAMPEGGKLTVSLRAAGGDWAIGIADTGVGIPPEQLEKIFEPFQSHFDAGTGLGLAIVYQIVQAHEGRITVSSKSGYGTEFTLRLRRAGSAVTAREPQPELAASAKVTHG
jgi:two-component system, NtrC family, sensor histidine kinase PilS